MKNLVKLTLLMACIGIMQCCSNEDPFEDLYAANNNANGNSGGSGAMNTAGGTFSNDVLLTTFDINIDKTSAEPANAAAAYLPDEEDCFDASTFVNVVSVAFDGNTASCSAVDGVTISTDGAHVVASHGDTKGVCYQVSGTTTNGSLTIVGNKKYEVLLSGAHISNPDSAALDMLSKKRAFVVLAEGTSNSLADGSSSKATDQKAALYCKGKLLVSGKGTLEVSGNYNNAIHSSDYIVFEKGINVYAKSTAGHGVKANDGIFINGGIINVEVTAAAAKGFNCESSITVNGGRTTIITSGDVAYDDEDQEYKGSAAVKCDSIFTMNGGEMFLKSTGTGGKGIRAGWEAYIKGGTIAIVTTGGQYSYNRETVSAKGIKVGTKNTHGLLDITGGSTTVRTSGKSSEGVESKGSLTVDGVDAMVAVAATDDAINSAGDFSILAGSVMGYSTGNDGLDANGNFYIKGGLVYAIGTSQPEVGIDANSEGGYSLYVSGGTVIAIGGVERGSSLTQTSYSAQWTPNTWYALSSDGKTMAFLTPASSGSSMFVSTSSTPVLTQGVNPDSGTSIFGGMALTGASTSGGSQVSLSSYADVGGAPGGGFGPRGW